ncbi:MAG: 3-deoxy-manno-octulosonate cytidylyltransferase [bacterium]
MKIIGFIPARLKSTRLPEKLLRPIMGKPLIQYVYENAKRIKILDALYVATDSKKIKAIVEKAGCSVIMTSPDCASGTERVVEALKKIKTGKNDIIVNIQGDEPALEPGNVALAIKALVQNLNCDVATLAVKIKNMKDLADKAAVKVVLDNDNVALYFSRAQVPCDRDVRNEKPEHAYKHVGLYVYRKKVLAVWKTLKSKYEHIEKLEQLRLVENGYKIKVIIVKSASIGIDTIQDFESFKKRIENES